MGQKKSSVLSHLKHLSPIVVTQVFHDYTITVVGQNYSLKDEGYNARIRWVASLDRMALLISLTTS